MDQKVKNPISQATSGQVMAVKTLWMFFSCGGGVLLPNKFPKPQIDHNSQAVKFAGMKIQRSLMNLDGFLKLNVL